MGRWTQYDEDSYRLPEGVTRVGYDADTQKYTFVDHHGQMYEGAPRAEYGHLAPISSSTPSAPRRKVYATDKPLPKISADGKEAPKTFSDILPDALVASPLTDSSSHWHRRSSSTPDSSQPKKPLVESVRGTTLPRMRGVVHNVMKRSATIARWSKTKASPRDNHERSKSTSDHMSESTARPSNDDKLVKTVSRMSTTSNESTKKSLTGMSTNSR